MARSQPWLVAAEWPLPARISICAGIALAYLVAFALGGPDLEMALRPVNLVLVVLAGLFFGARAGFLISLAAVVVNVALYRSAGIFAQTPGTLSGNVLSIFVGIGAGTGVGWMRDLSLQLRREVLRRIEAERHKDELTALLVHDLKNPLTAISGHAQLLAMEEEEGDGLLRESAQYIQSAAERLGRMVMNLLDIGRAEDGKLVPQYQPVELSRMLNEIQGSLQRQLSDRELRFEVVQKADDGRVQADPELLRRLLVNLLDNAIKYTPRQRTVRVELGGTEQEIELVVRDEGPGIPAGYEERIFEKYTRLDRDGGYAAEASRGLGLHFCKLAAAAHGGRIWVEPSGGSGSAFRVRLPRTPTARA